MNNMTPSKSDYRKLKYAVKAAHLSESMLHKVGAAVFKGKSLISIGWGSKRTHPESKTFNCQQHAEFMALAGTWKYDMVGAVVYVARIANSGLRLAKPCSSCEQVLRAAGVKRVWYTNNDGQLEAMDL